MVKKTTNQQVRSGKKGKSVGKARQAEAEVIAAEYARTPQGLAQLREARIAARAAGTVRGGKRRTRRNKTRRTRRTRK
jgi:hypothetical protein